MKRRLPALLLACAALTATITAAPRSRADEATTEAATIAVLCAPGDRFGLRVQAELEALGFHAVLLDPTALPASRAALEAAARSAGAIAAIRAVPSERGVELWIADRVTGKTVLREVVGAAGGDRDDALALSTVDLLRASLLEVTLPAPPPGDLPAPPKIREQLALPAPPTKPSAPTLRLSLAPGLLLSPGGFAPAASLDLGLAWMPSEHVGVSGFAAIPLSRPSVDDLAGSADLSALLAGGGARFVFASRSSRWSPSADLGVMAVAMQSRGTAKSGFLSKDVSAATASPFARVGLAYAPIPQLRLRADVLVGVVVQGVSIELAGREAARWGQPIVLPTIGIDFGWF